MQRIFIIGNLTNQPETRTTTSGVTVCVFDVAVSRRFAQGGQKQTDFFRVNAWRGLGENCRKFLSKGKKVAVMGELQPRSYEKDGQTRFSLDITADEIEFLSPMDKAESPYSQGAPDMPELRGFETLREDQLPF